MPVSSGVATIQAARGNHQYLDALVLRHGDAYALMQAVGLPCDWTSLVPCPETKAQVIDVTDELQLHGENPENGGKRGKQQEA